jgi:orotate phosphoribosyltransferase/AMMECR1 domain-containing protein
VTTLDKRRSELLDRLRTEAILYADGQNRIVGRGGRSAPWMLYCWPLTMTGSGAALVADQMLVTLADFEGTQLAAYGVGAIPLMTACLVRGGDRYRGLTVRSEPKPYGSRRQIEGAPPGAGEVILVDDSINSGTSVMTGIRVLESAGYEVEGAVCLVNFRYGGGVEYARARGYRVETLFDVWDDLQMPRLSRPPLYLRHLPDRWSAERVPDGLPPARVARLVAEHLLATDEVLRPPERFDDDESGPGGVWVSFRRRDNDSRLARDGFWHFDPGDANPTRDVVIAAAATARGFHDNHPSTALDEIKIAVTFLSELERVEPRDLDFRRYGIVVRSLHVPAKVGGALPNTQLYTSAFEQYRHARVVNARIGRFEPHEVFRHDVRKLAEPGERWPAYGEDEAGLEAWTRSPDLGTALVDRVWQVLAGSDLAPARVLDVPPGEVRAVCVSLYDRGLIGCAVAYAGAVDDMLAAATRHALDDARFGVRRASGARPRAVTVSLLYEPERHVRRSPEYVAWKMRAGRDSLLVQQRSAPRRRWAVFLDSVIPHYNWSKRQAAEQLMAKAGVTSGVADWVTYKTVSWCGTTDTNYPLEFGGRQRTGEGRLGHDDLAAMATHLYRRLDDDGWPASRVLCRLGTYERRGAAARCLHALQTLHETGISCDRPDWAKAAQRGLDHALRHLDEGGRLSVPNHDGGPIADALLLGAVSALGDASRVTAPVHQLAARLGTWIRADGSIRPEGALPSTTDPDHLPGEVLLALARYSETTGHPLELDWAGIRTWYERRFRLVHPWGLAYWHCQAWTEIAQRTGDDSHLGFVFEMADWMVEHQLRADGSFFTDLAPSPSWHTACPAAAMVEAWRAALRVGGAERARRYHASWEAAMRFLDRLIVRPDDAYWMPRPEIAIGGIRAMPASFQQRVDSTSETLQALLRGLALRTSSR